MQDIVSSIQPLILIAGKGGILVFLGIYILFAFVMVRQVNIMTKTLELGLEPVIIVISYLHLFFAIAIFAISLIML